MDNSKDSIDAGAKITGENLAHQVGDEIAGGGAGGKNQFSLQSIFWLTVALSLLFSYARYLGGDALQQAMIFSLMGLAVGCLLGPLVGNWQDSIFWALLMTLLAYLATAGGRLPNLAVFYGWGLVGAFCGSMSLVKQPVNLIAGAILMGALSSLVMVATLCCFGEPLKGLVLFDVGSAAVIGAILRPFLHYLQWFEKQSSQPRVIMASWLAISVLIGNFLVPILGGVER